MADENICAESESVKKIPTKSSLKRIEPLPEEDRQEEHRAIPDIAEIPDEDFDDPPALRGQQNLDRIVAEYQHELDHLRRLRLEMDNWDNEEMEEGEDDFYLDVEPEDYYNNSDDLDSVFTDDEPSVPQYGPAKKGCNPSGCDEHGNDGPPIGCGEAGRYPGQNQDMVVYVMMDLTHTS